MFDSTDVRNWSILANSIALMVSDIIAVMAVFGIAPELDTFSIDDVYAVTGPVPYDKQLSILDVLGQGWGQTEDSSHDD